MVKFQVYLKALYGAIAAALGATATAFADGRISWQEGVFISIAFWGALGIIWGVPNIPTSTTRTTLKREE